MDRFEIEEDEGRCPKRGTVNIVFQPTDFMRLKIQAVKNGFSISGLARKMIFHCLKDLETKPIQPEAPITKYTLPIGRKKPANPY